MSFEQIFSQARREKRTVLTEIESKRILIDAGIHCTDTRLARTREEALSLGDGMGYPGGLKKESLSSLIGRRGASEALRKAVKGMLPRNTMLVARLKNLTVKE